MKKQVYISGGTTVLEILLKCMKAQSEVAKKALSDSNDLCKKKTGRLIASGKCNEFTGELSWDTPYARRVYYTGKPNRSVNPKAGCMWAHRAAIINGKAWESIIKGVLL